MSIHQKFFNVQSSLKVVPKNGFNSFHRYPYAQEQDVLAAINPLCIENKLTHFITVEEANIEKGCASVKVKLVLTDIETGESLESLGWGYAEDAKGDKAIYKATTGATKYVYLKFFGLSTGDDPERDEEPVKKTQKPNESKSVKVTDISKSEPKENRQQILNEIGELFKKHNLKREDFPNSKAIQAPKEATLQELKEALSSIKSAIEGVA